MLAFIALWTTILFSLNLANAKVYIVPEGWSCVNNKSLQEFPASGTSGRYRLVSAFVENDTSKQQLVLSENGTFGLAFLNFNGTGNYHLSVMMGTQFFKNSSLAAPIWTANRNDPVSENATLTISRGRLSLFDLRSDTVFTVGINITSLSLEEDGNLKFLNSSGDIVWQSFEHPTDVLVPGQKLITGEKLTSNGNDTAMHEGHYTAVAEASGVVIYYSAKQPYFVWSLGGPLLGAALKVCDGFQTVLRFTLSGGVSMRHEATQANSGTQACGTPLRVGLSSAANLAYLQLGYDGNVNAYILDDSGLWTRQFQITQYLGGGSLCQLPLACGKYGICQGNRECSCLDKGANNISSASTSCSMPAWASLEKCSNRYETNFVTISGGSYFTNQYMSPDRVSTLGDCLETCRANCSCAAMFYDSSRRNCYFIEEVLGSLRVDKSQNQLTGFLKFQNYSRLIPLNTPRSNKRLIAGAVSGVGVAAVVITSALLLSCYYIRKHNLADEEINKLLTSMEGPPHRFSYKRLSHATSGFSKLLGTGGFGSVYEGEFSDGRKIAVKKLHSRKQGQVQFITEVASLGTISHINIVRLCGFCANSSRRLLVYEYMKNGSLDKWIFSKSGSPLSWNLRWNIALGTARGLAYLHEECREPIIHLDIKPQNILLDENFVAKVGDFGMAKLLMSREMNQVVTGVRGTPGYLAPEWLLQSTATKKCDVYSYGMVLLEIIGGRRNLDPAETGSDMSWFFPAWAVNQVQNGSLSNVVDPNVRDEADISEVERMVKVAFWCIQENPAARPTMDTVVHMLEGQQDISEPPLMFYFAVQATGILSITASSECTALGYTDSLGPR